MPRIKVCGVDPALRHGAIALMTGDPWSEDTNPDYGWRVEDVRSYHLPTRPPERNEYPDGRCYSIIDRRINNAILTAKPSIVVVEGVGGVDYSGGKSLRAAAVLHVVRGIIDKNCYELRVPYAAPFAGKIKASLAVTKTGKPDQTAKKTAVMDALRHLGLYDGTSDDEADAIAVCWYAMKAIRAGEIILPEGARV